MSRVATAALAVLFVLIALVIPAHAVQVELTRPELCSLVDDVVMVRIVSMTPRRARDGAIERVVEAEVAAVFKGADRARVRFVLPGGELDGKRLWVSDTPNLLRGADYLLFLSGDTDDERRVQGGEAGAVRITPAGSARGETAEHARASLGVCRVD